MGATLEFFWRFLESRTLRLLLKSASKYKKAAQSGKEGSIREGLEMAAKKDRVIIHLACTECKERNYTTTKNKRNDPNRLEFNKFCRRCRNQKLHRETK